MTDSCILCNYSRDWCPDQCPVARTGGHIWYRGSMGSVYVMCGSGLRRFLEQADRRNANPAVHYVGWTRQKVVTNRVAQHGWPSSTLAFAFPGTPADEEACKERCACPRCGRTLSLDCLGWPAEKWRFTPVRVLAEECSAKYAISYD